VCESCPYETIRAASLGTLSLIERCFLLVIPKKTFGNRGFLASSCLCQDVVSPTHQFDSSTYLASNPDVAKALEEGRIISAWGHFVQWGYRENRNGVPENLRQLVQSIMALSKKVPPDRLILRVHGSTDAASFELIGKRIALDIYRVVGTRIDLDSVNEIFDFGCGCGRILSYMSEIAPLSHFQATDIDEEAIAWCGGHYGDAVANGRFKFMANKDRPPVTIESGTFDLVYAISVFTHLPEDMQLQWIAELQRVTKKGGILVISVSGDGLIRKHLNPENLCALDEKGFFYHPYGSTAGLPDYYQAAWHTRDYVERAWSKYFKIVDYIRSGISDHQDLVICVKQ
jgi:SAM-dependent methyltransferase